MRARSSLNFCNFSINPGNFSSCPRSRASRLWVRLDSRLRGNDGNSQLLKNCFFCPELLRSYLFRGYYYLFRGFLSQIQGLLLPYSGVFYFSLTFQVILASVLGSGKRERTTEIRTASREAHHEPEGYSCEGKQAGGSPAMLEHPGTANHFAFNFQNSPRGRQFPLV